MTGDTEQTQHVNATDHTSVVEKAIQTVGSVVDILQTEKEDQGKDLVNLLESLFSTALLSELKRVSPLVADLDEAAWPILAGAVTRYFAPKIQEALGVWGI